MALKKYLILFLILVVATNFLSSDLYSQEADSVSNFTLVPVEINAKRINLGDQTNKISKDNLGNILGQNGFNLIRKGVFFAQDIYADGLKKGDINVVIDGERYHSACPNRMDSPLTRINPMELEAVDLTKSCCNIQSGLGGVVNFRRAAPMQNLNFKVGLSALTGAQEGIDFAASGDYSNHKVSLRYAEGKPFKDSDGNTFKDSYNFKDNYNYKLAEGSIRGSLNQWSYGASFSYTDNVSFPYLLMDERFNRVYSAHLKYDKHKVYFNYTNHVMDNDLRVSKVLMRTDVKNLTIGAIGDFYEVVYRNWDAGNFFKNPMIDIKNDLMPNVSTYLVNLFKAFTFDQFQLHTKLGLSYQSVGNESRKAFYEEAHSNIDLNRTFPLFGLGLSYTTAISNTVGAGILLEVNSESPETESLFIAVKKPGTKPAWVGNPNLDQPIKSTIRTSFTYQKFSVEFFGSMVWNYNNLAKKVVNNKKYLTFSNVDAQIIGTNLRYAQKYIEIDASYIWAKNRTSEIPLSEIPPLSISTKLISPEFYSISVYAKHIYNDAQNRVNLLLNESSTPAWNRLDIGINYTIANISLSLDVENLLEGQYYQHLSYLRNPFSANSRIYEPGRTFRITFKTNSLF